MYMHIGILGRSSDNIYIYIDVVFTYYSKEDGSADTTATPSQAPWAVWRLLEAVRSQAGSLNRRKCNSIKGSQYFLKNKCYSKIK